jgi:hypothetical protein
MNCGPMTDPILNVEDASWTIPPLVSELWSGDGIRSQQLYIELFSSHARRCGFPENRCEW